MATRITHYDVGDIWQPQASWTVGGVATDPTTILVTQQDPAGVESTVTSASNPVALTSASTPMARMSAGVYKLNPGISLTSAGYWFAKFTGTGAAAASETQQAIADPDEFSNALSSRALVTLAECKDWLQQQNITTGEDMELVRTINDVSDRIHYEAGREFKAADAVATRTFEIDSYDRCVYVGDLGTLTTASPAATLIASDWTTTIVNFAPADISSYPLHREPWEPITKLKFSPYVSPNFFVPGMRMQVTGTWGFPAVPGNIRQAALDTVAAVMDRDAEHFRQDLGTVTPGGEGGNVVVMQQAQPMFLSLPPSAFAVCRAYREPFVG